MRALAAPQTLCATSLGVLAFWGGMSLAGRRYPRGVRLAIHDHIELGLRRPQSPRIPVGAGWHCAVWTGRAVLDDGSGSPGQASGRHKTASRNMGLGAGLSMHDVLCLVARAATADSQRSRFPRAPGVCWYMHWDGALGFQSR